MLESANQELTLKLLSKTNYQLVQDNGQRTYGPPPDWTGPPPRNTEVFVGSLPRDIFEYELVPFFERIGRIYMLRTMLAFSGYNRGYAFVKYCRPEDAKRAIRELNNAEIRPGQRIGVVRSLDNCRLYIGNLPTNRSREEIFSEISSLTEGVIDVIVHEDRQTGNKNRGFAFVEYATHKAAAKARRKLLPAHISLWDQTLSIDWATPEPKGNCTQSLTNLYVRNLKPEVTEQRLYEFFSFNGLANLLKVKKISNYAFLNYQTREDAQKVLQFLKNCDTREFSMDNLNLDITWAKVSSNSSSKQQSSRSPVQSKPTTQQSPLTMLPTATKSEPVRPSLPFPVPQWTNSVPSTVINAPWPEPSPYSPTFQSSLVEPQSPPYFQTLYKQLGLSTQVDFVV